MARVDMTYAESAEISGGSGSADALFDLGMMYCIGRGVSQDLVAAHKWFNLAALRGSDLARQYRLEISREMTNDDIAEAQRQARDWMSMH